MGFIPSLLSGLNCCLSKALGEFYFKILTPPSCVLLSPPPPLQSSPAVIQHCCCVVLVLVCMLSLTIVDDKLEHKFHEGRHVVCLLLSTKHLEQQHMEGQPQKCLWTKLRIV